MYSTFPLRVNFFQFRVFTFRPALQMECVRYENLRMSPVPYGYRYERDEYTYIYLDVVGASLLDVVVDLAFFIFFQFSILSGGTHRHVLFIRAK